MKKTMNTILVWDSETSGIPLFDQPSEDPRQPHIVQLAAILVDLDTRKTLASMDVIVRPDGWTIPDDVAAIHGITTDKAMELGVPERDVVALFLALGGGRTHVAHNSSFDERIMRIALKRLFSEADAEQFKARHFECTQRLATPILKLPPTDKMKAARRFHHKSANLTEAYLHFTGKQLVDAHSAMADVQACAAVYFAIKSRVQEPLAA